MSELVTQEQFNILVEIFRGTDASNVTFTEDVKERLEDDLNHTGLNVSRDVRLELVQRLEQLSSIQTYHLIIAIWEHLEAEVTV